MSHPTVKSQIAILPRFIEQKLRQLILKDLISDKNGEFYKKHTEAMLKQAEIIINEKKLSKNVAQQLMLAVYAYHWGCCNLHDQPGHSHSEPLEHLDVCFKLSATKLERSCIYYFPDFLTQEKLLEMVNAIETQTNKFFVENSVASLLRLVAITTPI